MTVSDQAEDGRGRREVVPRASHGAWVPAIDRPDPIDVLLASNQGRLEDLIPIRFGRMAVSPFTFLRGSASVMAADLAAVPTTGLEVQACGDCHLMNFGLFATPERNVVFGVNDFDETMPGPWEWDLKRLVASFVVAARDVRLPDDRAVEAAASVVRTYRERMWEYAELSPLAIWYDRIDLAREIEDAPDKVVRRNRERLHAQARRRVGENLFPKLVETDGGRMSIVDQPPLIFHPPGLTPELALEFLDAYRASLSEDRRVLFDRYRFADIAIKIVGVGSVGTRCFVVLLTSEDRHPLLLQVKEANDSVMAPYLDREGREAHNGKRVVVGQHLMQPASDIFLGWASAPSGREFYVRQLRDMKVSVSLIADPDQFLNYARYCGLALARAHANTGAAAAIAGYLGTSTKVDASLAQFGVAYADQTERDHRALVDAIDGGRIHAVLDIA